MSEELHFNNELRECLDAAGYSDCGENDQWNYWFQRLHKAHDAAVDRVTEVQRAENAKLRELCRHLYTCMERQEPDGSLLCASCPYENESNECDYELRMQELGIEVDA